MLQFDMIIVQPDQLGQREAEVHIAGTPLREGGGDETYRCGGCKTKLLIKVAHHDAHGALIKCGKCNKVNAEPHHH